MHLVISHGRGRSFDPLIFMTRTETRGRGGRPNDQGPRPPSAPSRSLPPAQRTSS